MYILYLLCFAVFKIPIRHDNCLKYNINYNYNNNNLILVD